MILDRGKRLGKNITGYRSRWFTPDKRNQMQVFSYKPIEGAEEEIYRAISDITVSMKSVDYLHLPEVSTIDHEITLAARDAELYRQLERDMFAEIDGAELSVTSAGALAGKLLQATAGAIYTDEAKNWKPLHAAKLDALADLVEQANGQPVLVAYWFRHDAERIQAHIPGARLLRDRVDFEAWNRGDIPVALIHPASAGHGLNLQTGGHILVWFTPCWSLELYQQTNARLHRQGQTQPVTIHRILVADSIDGEVVKALSTKDKTQDALITALKARAKTIHGGK